MFTNISSTWIRFCRLQWSLSLWKTSQWNLWDLVSLFLVKKVIENFWYVQGLERVLVPFASCAIWTRMEVVGRSFSVAVISSNNRTSSLAGHRTNVALAIWHATSGWAMKRSTPWLTKTNIVFTSTWKTSPINLVSSTTNGSSSPANKPSTLSISVDIWRRPRAVIHCRTIEECDSVHAIKTTINRRRINVPRTTRAVGGMRDAPWRISMDCICVAMIRRRPVSSGTTGSERSIRWKCVRSKFDPRGSTRRCSRKMTQQFCTDFFLCNKRALLVILLEFSIIVRFFVFSRQNRRNQVGMTFVRGEQFAILFIALRTNRVKNDNQRKIKNNFSDTIRSIDCMSTGHVLEHQKPLPWLAKEIHWIYLLRHSTSIAVIWWSISRTRSPIWVQKENTE